MIENSGRSEELRKRTGHLPPLGVEPSPYRVNNRVFRCAAQSGGASAAQLHRLPCRRKRDAPGYVQHDSNPTGVFEAMILQCGGALPERGASEPHIRVANLETHLIELHLRRHALAASETRVA